VAGAASPSRQRRHQLHRRSYGALRVTVHCHMSTATSADANHPNSGIISSALLAVYFSIDNAHANSVRFAMWMADGSRRPANVEPSCQAVPDDDSSHDIF